MAKTLFEHLKDLTYTKEVLKEEDEKSYSQYMINRFVSMNSLYIDIISDVFNRSDIPKDIHHAALRKIMPKKNTFFKYIKKSTEDYDKELMDKLVVTLELSKREISRLLDDIDEKQRKKYITDYLEAHKSGIVSKKRGKKS